MKNEYLQDLMLRLAARNPAQPEYIFTEIGIGYRMIDAEA